MICKLFFFDELALDILLFYIEFMNLLSYMMWLLDLDIMKKGKQ